MRGGAWLVPVDEVYSRMTIRVTKEKPLEKPLKSEKSSNVEAKDSTTTR